MVWKRFSYLLSLIFCVGCGVQTATSSKSLAPYCAVSVPSTPITGTTGTGLIFNVDPMVATGNASVAPGDPSLSTAVQTATLQNLYGYGTLYGAYMDVVNELCGQGYGAQSTTNNFQYTYGDERFPEVMSYYYGDLFRDELDANGVLYSSPAPMVLIANCDERDNAYYTQGVDSSTGNTVDFVCVGTGSAYSTANFADDASVVIHELQHGITQHAYSATIDFNQLSYDDAGVVNEAVSDFAGMMFLEPMTGAPFDATRFSRWALDLFFSPTAVRGGKKCPEYDSAYGAGCTSFSKTAAGFSSDNNHISYAFPDGLGWPYGQTVSGPNYVRTTWINNDSFEEIHQGAPVVAGTLYDLYLELRANGKTAAQSRGALMKILTEALKQLPIPSGTNVSPITIQGFFTEIATQINASTDLNAGDKTDLLAALTTRGVRSPATVAAAWASVGTGTADTAGVRFIDTTPTSGTRNYKFNVGDSGVMWFDLSNSDADTAASVLLDVTILDPGIEFSGLSKNYGYLSTTHAQIRYAKVNGTSIVDAFDSTSSPAHPLPSVGNSYFGTNYNYDSYSTTGLWVKVKTNATPGSNVRFQVVSTPSNGPAVTNTFTVGILP